jgi:demethoxyubiquinone hydroxylase (CLK1/Coq7/Cat5 family)
MTTTVANSDQTIDQLNSFLRGELAAVDTYHQALEKVKNAGHRLTVEEIHRSHKKRAELLHDEVQRRGGIPAKGAGVWGTFAKAVEGSARIFGEKAAFAALEEGEDHGRDDYQRDIGKLDESGRLLIENRVLPEQVRTHNALASIVRSLA